MTGIPQRGSAPTGGQRRNHTKAAGWPPTTAVDGARDNLCTAAADGVREAVHSLWISLGTIRPSRVDLEKLFPQAVRDGNLHRRVAPALGTLDGVTTWRTERRFGDDDAVDPWHDPRTDPWHDESPPRRPLTPRQRFGPPVPISPPVSPVVQRPAPQPPALQRPAPQPPVMRVTPPPPLTPRHVRRRTPRNRYDWRVTKHAAREVEIVD